MNSKHANEYMTVPERLFILAHLRRMNVKPFMTKTAHTHYRRRILRKYQVDIDSPPSKLAYELLVDRGALLHEFDDIPMHLHNQRVAL